jgi:hypothetical protein
MAITRLNNNSITSITALPSAISLGKVLQVVGTTITSNESGNTNSEQMISNYVAQITPTLSTSKVLVLFSGPAQTEDTNSAGQNCAFKLRINTGSSASLSSTDYQQVRFGAYNYASASGTTEEHGVLSFNYLHSPATTSAVHVGISVSNYDGNPNWRLGIANYKSHFTLMEIGA